MLIKVKTHKILLSLFVTFLVMNAITYTIFIHLAGKYGKLLVAMVGIALLQKSINQLVDFLEANKYLLIFWFLCVSFTVLWVFDNGFNGAIIQNNTLFVLFIYFFYLLSEAFKSKSKRPYFSFFKTLANTLNYNLFFWTALAIVLPFKIWHTLEDRTGLGLFYENYIQLGIFSCAGAIANFSVYRDKTAYKFYYLSMAIIYAILAVLSNSRNPQLVLLVYALFNLFPYIKRGVIKYMYVLVFLIVLGSVLFLSVEVLNSSTVSSFTTGRSRIWYHIIDYYSTNSIFKGHGIFGLNDIILQTNIDGNYYFQRLEFLYFHSSYMEIFSASGILGLLFFFFFLGKSLYEKKNYYISIVIIGISIGGFFESFIIQPTVLISFLFWYLIISKPSKRKTGFKKHYRYNHYDSISPHYPFCL
ncbi:O-antigen ligase family protein [Aquimarina agarivorans]|uniref:O-antigen ligase family protein n=1 Tax=Aquimarina agarivorans TaxID=980584 RepID=UPI000248E850|nr:O-antigen ligase family protein [Aquimarina agarivorans]